MRTFSMLFSILFCIFPENFSLLPIFSTFGEIWAKTLGYRTRPPVACAVDSPAKDLSAKLQNDATFISQTSQTKLEAVVAANALDNM